MTPYRESGKPLDTKPSLVEKQIEWLYVRACSGQDEAGLHKCFVVDPTTKQLTKQREFLNIIHCLETLENEGYELVPINSYWVIKNQSYFPENYLLFRRSKPTVYEYGNLNYCSSSNVSSMVGYTLATGRYTETDLRQFNYREVLNWLSEQGWEPADGTEFKLFRRIIRNKE